MSTPNHMHRASHAGSVGSSATAHRSRWWRVGRCVAGAVAVFVGAGQARAAGDGAAADLRFRVPAGTTLRYIVDSSRELDRDVMGKKNAMRWATRVHLELEVISQEAQRVEAKVRYARVQVTVPPPGGGEDVTLDTASTPSATQDDIEAYIRRLVDKPLTIVALPDGTIESVAGEEAFAPLPAWNAFLDEYTEEASIKKAMVELFSPGPGAPDAARPSDTWKRTSSEAGMGGAATIERVVTYTLEKASSDEATIAATSAVTLTTKPGFTGTADEKTSSYGGVWNMREGCLESWTSDGEATLALESPRGKATVRSAGKDRVRRVAEFPK